MRLIPVVAAAIILVFGLAVSPVAADPIHDAVQAGDVAELKRLLASGVKVDARKPDCMTPLHWAGTSEIAKVLLKAGAKVNARDQSGLTPLHWAAFFDRAGVVEFLLKAGANAKAKDKSGYTSFDFAESFGRLKGTDAYWLLNEAQYD